jgi:hypothetical protein
MADLFNRRQQHAVIWLARGNTLSNRHKSRAISATRRTALRERRPSGNKPQHPMYFNDLPEALLRPTICFPSSHLYRIPIKAPALPSRKNIPQVTIHVRSKQGSVCALPMQIKRGASRTK